MMDDLDFYTGRVIGPDVAAAETQPAATEPTPDPEALLDQARQEARAILESAEAEAAERRHEHWLASLVEICDEPRRESARSQPVLLGLLVQTVERIVGDMPELAREERALAAAIRAHADAKTLRVRIASDVHPRFRIIALGARGTQIGQAFDVVEDPDLPQGRCRIEVDGRTYDCDARSQVEAFSKLVRRLATAQAAA